MLQKKCYCKFTFFIYYMYAMHVALVAVVHEHCSNLVSTYLLSNDELTRTQYCCMMLVTYCSSQSFVWTAKEINLVTRTAHTSEKNRNISSAIESIV